MLRGQLSSVCLRNACQDKGSPHYSKKKQYYNLSYEYLKSQKILGFIVNILEIDKTKEKGDINTFKRCLNNNNNFEETKKKKTIISRL